MRTLTQPGPPHPLRIDCLRGDPHRLDYRLQPGVPLNEALTRPLLDAGLQSATIVVRSAAVNPFQYVMPGPPDDASHVAYFTAPRAPAGTSRIEQANASFGWAGGKPFVHCHAVWHEPDGSRRGGHILPRETHLLEPADATAWGFRDIRLEASPDPETNFTLFQPTGVSAPDSRGVLARVKPNQDILTAMETIARSIGIADALVVGSLGSLVGAQFVGGDRVDDIATEVLVRQGFIRGGRAALDMLVVDMAGGVHEGWLEHGKNPVCITFDLVLHVQPPAACNATADTVSN